MHLNAAPTAGPTLRLDALRFHGLMVLLLVTGLIAYVQTLNLGADNNWHFRLARDIVLGRPIYWSGVDGNRLFPDLLFSILACLLPGGLGFGTWIYYFYALFLVSLYLSLVALGAALYPRAAERRTFVVVAVAGLWLAALASPFWGAWILNPGNHGTGIPVCFLALAIVCSVLRTGRLDPLLCLVLVLSVALLTASNRYLMVAFVAPICLALVVGVLGPALLAVRRERAGPSGAAARAELGRGTALLLATLAAGYCGHLGWRVLSALPWHVVAVVTGIRKSGDSIPAWLGDRIVQEFQGLATPTDYKPSVVAALLLMLSTIPVGVAFLTRALRRRSTGGEASVQAFYVLFVTFSAVLACTFIVFIVSDVGDWRYRFLTVTVAFALALLALLATNLIASWGWRWSDGLSAVGITAAIVLTGAVAMGRGRAEIAQYQAFLNDADRLADIVRKHTGRDTARGFAEYWAANDLSARADRLEVDTLEPERPVFRFYVNNAGLLCGGDHTFIVRRIDVDQPARGAIVAELGEPAASETMHLTRFGQIEVMIYDPALLRERVTEKARSAARAIFPTFRCPPPAAGPSEPPPARQLSTERSPGGRSTREGGG